MQTKKICFYISVINGGGAARVLILVAEGLARRGYQCTFITSFRDYKWEYPLSNNVRRVVLDKDEESGNYVLKNFRRIARLRHICKKEKPDYLITFISQPILRSLIATIGLEIRNIISIRNDPALYWRKPLEKILSALLLRRAYWTVFQTNTAREYFAGKKLYKRSQVIANPVTSVFYSVKYNPDSKTIVACGRLTEQKNYPLMINSFFEVSKDYPEWTLEIYGKGSLEEDIKKRIQDLGCSSIIMKGHDDNVPRILSESAIFLMTSNFEGMPNALMEALAAGIPCISTDCPCGGPKTLISDRFNGYLIPVNGKKELCDALRKLMNSQEERIRLSQNASVNALQYKEDAVLDIWETMLNTI